MTNDGEKRERERKNRKENEIEREKRMNEKDGGSEGEMCGRIRFTSTITLQEEEM